jgi:hypothetical protein
MYLLCDRCIEPLSWPEVIVQNTSYQKGFEWYNQMGQALSPQTQ